jgi:hypothetical protein
MRYLLFLLLIPAAVSSEEVAAVNPPADTAHVIAATHAPCTLPNARLLQFRRQGSMSTFRPADATRQMDVEPGKYTSVMECARVANAATNAWEELHKRKERGAFEIDIHARTNYVFGCRLREHGKVGFYFTRESA